MAEAVGLHQDPARADGVDEERVRAIEGVDEATLLVLGPARGLDRTGDLDGEFVEVALPLVVGQAALEHQAAQVAVGREVVEAVVVDADVRDVRGHVSHRP